MPALVVIAVIRHPNVMMASTARVSSLGRQNVLFMIRAYCTEGTSKGAKTKKADTSSTGSSGLKYYNTKRTYGQTQVDMMFYDREVEALPYRLKQPTSKPATK